MLYESHTSLGHNVTTRLYKFLKTQYYWKVRHCLQCQTTNLQTTNYIQLHSDVPQMPMGVTSMDLIGPFEVASGNQYAFTVICMLTNYIM